MEHLDEILLAQNEIENLNYTIEYCVDDNHEISNELVEIINDGQANDIQETNNEENNIDNIAYETVVTDEIDETQNLVEEYLDHDETMGEGVEYQIISQDVNDQSEILTDFDNSQDTVGEENHVEYTTEDVGVENHGEYTTEDLGEENQEVEYLDDELNEESAQDVAVQTAESADGNSSTAHSLLPVFDVYMKDGNVTGFVVNDNLITGLKEGVDKEIQTSEDVTPR